MGEASVGVEWCDLDLGMSRDDSAYSGIRGGLWESFARYCWHVWLESGLFRSWEFGVIWELVAGLGMLGLTFVIVGAWLRLGMLGLTFVTGSWLRG